MNKWKENLRLLGSLCLTSKCFMTSSQPLKMNFMFIQQQQFIHREKGKGVEVFESRFSPHDGFAGARFYAG